jgi:hypothetical protein
MNVASPCHRGCRGAPLGFGGAGMRDAILVGRNGGTTRLSASGLPLGVLRDGRRQVRSVNHEAGDLLVLYSTRWLKPTGPGLRRTGRRWRPGSRRLAHGTAVSTTIPHAGLARRFSIPSVRGWKRLEDDLLVVTGALP